jgi:adenylate cyclase
MLGSESNHAEQACRCALVMFERLQKLNRELAQEARRAAREHRVLTMGIGIESGECIVGNFGSEQRFDFTAMGRAVNLVFALQNQSENYGVDIVVGEGTKALAPTLAMIELDLVVASEATEPTRIFALLGDARTAKSPEYASLLAEHDAMLASYRRREWDPARRHLMVCRDKEPKLTGLYDLYNERIRRHEASPPPPDWRGIVTLSTR